MYIDIHSHAYWKPTPFVTKFFTPEELIEAQKMNGIENASFYAGDAFEVVANEKEMKAIIEKRKETERRMRRLKTANKSLKNFHKKSPLISAS